MSTVVTGDDGWWVTSRWGLKSREKKKVKTTKQKSTKRTGVRRGPGYNGIRPQGVTSVASRSPCSLVAAGRGQMASHS